ncbi:unnamed protein product [Rotaria sp. Silwood2]|nr:unnamed protein product [Rotaria sp. Silwood2]CAF3364056.1 unnamed protein product [Rotaria sp. Silwood2]CAF4232340.1 unnamed protein product [Rotaria sp. Silwood2]CAF4266652.1 unnamed protein product [Rotaria sp. Silwood2]CAF4273354.1 unnamed protein product [Rotaria sp. Silwood2]
MFIVFNVGDYRRDAVKVYSGKDFFDPGNTEAVAIRNQCAQNALEDMCDFLQNQGEVAIFDATNTTRERRRTIYNHCTETCCFRVFFVESICDSLEVIQANIRQVKLKSPDYKDVSQTEAVADFLSRIQLYEKQYETIDDKTEEKHYSFIKIFNCGERFLVHKIGGAKINAPKEQWKALNGVNAGIFEGLTYREVAERYPKEFAARDQSKYYYRYPGGESYHDLVARLEPVIMELESAENVLVITHQAVARCILAYFLDKDPERLPYIKVPLHTIIKLTPMAYGCMMECIPLSVEAVNTHRSKPKNCEPNRAVAEALNEFSEVRLETKTGPTTTQVIYQNAGTALETTDAHGNRLQHMDSAISDVTPTDSFSPAHDGNIQQPPTPN